MPGIQYHVDIKDISKFEHQNNISVNVYVYEDKKSSRNVLPPWLLQDITWIFSISLLVKNLPDKSEILKASKNHRNSSKASQLMCP